MLINKNYIKIYCIFLLCVVSVFVDAEEHNEFKNFFNFQSLKADFEQKIYDENNNLIITTFGYILFKRPTSLMWSNVKPNKQVFLMQDNHAWLVDYDLEQVSAQLLNKVAQSPLYFLINDIDNLDHVPYYDHQENGINWYLTNKKNNLKFGFKDTNFFVNFNNITNQKIELFFYNVQKNQTINSSVFELNVPPYFDIIK